MLKVQCDKCGKQGEIQETGWTEVVVIDILKKTKNLPPVVYHLCITDAIELEEYMGKSVKTDPKVIKIGDR